MPGKLKVQIVAGRNLPIMDRSSELTDAFVEVKFGSVTHKTDVYRKSLKPQWNSEWFRFEVDDEDLQDEPLQIRVLDHDTYSAHDAIGKVYIDLDPLLSKGNAHVISGWFPIYDTMHGIRGELNVTVKVDLFTDFNKFRQSSCGVQFFCTSGVPAGFRIQSLQGFVEELVVNDDPEHQWIDKIRSMRASNEARQLQFSKLTGELQRKIGLKVLEMGGNAVIGYRQCFDLEGESGIVVRAVGNSVVLNKQWAVPPFSASPHCDSASPIRDSSTKQYSPTSAPPVLGNMPVYRPRLVSCPQIAVIKEKQENNKLINQTESTILNKSYSKLQSGGNLTAQRASYSMISPPCAPGLDFSTPLMEEGSSSGGAQNSPLMTVTPVKAGGSSPLKVDSAGGIGGSGGSGVRVRRSSDSDLSTPPKGGGSLTGSSGSTGGSATKALLKQSQQLQNIDTMEYPFFSMRSFPPGFIVHLGGVVSARSVKLLDRIHNPDEPETRDAWWTELRTEIRSHARSMGCQAVIGYYETTAICDEIIILSACGTAAVVNIEMSGYSNLHHNLAPLTLDRPSLEKELERATVKESTTRERRNSGNTGVPSGGVAQGSGLGIDKELSKKLHVDINLANDVSAHRTGRLSDSEDEMPFSCYMCHIPYNEASLPFPVHLSRCSVCSYGQKVVLPLGYVKYLEAAKHRWLWPLVLRSKKVPDVLFTTVEPPHELPIIGKGCFIQARICRNKKELKGESHAKEISDSLPFMEYELHSQLIHKLRIKGMNSLFGLRITFCVGDKLLVAVATATGVFSASLPVPPPPKLVGIKEGKTSVGTLTDLQKKVSDEISRNIDRYNLFIPEFLQQQHSPPSVASTSEDMMEEDTGGGGILSDVDLATGNKDTFILEVDDAEDADIVAVLLDPPPPQGFDICNTEYMPGVPNVVCNLQTFTKVWRGQLSLTNNKSFSNVFNYLLRGLYFKLRKMAPCALCHLDFDIDLPEDDEIQISITGTCAGLGDPQIAPTQGLVSMCPQPQMEQYQSGGVGTGNIKSDINKQGNTTDDMMFDMEILTDTGAAPTRNMLQDRTKPSYVKHSPVLCKGLASMKEDRKVKYHCSPKHKPGVELTPLAYIPGGKIEKYLGHLNFFIVRETTSLNSEGGLNGFLHSFIAEVMAICRAHVAALGGNALVSYQMSECVLEDNIQKNQSQCLVNVYGDVVQVLYDTELQPVPDSRHHSTQSHQITNTNSPILKIKTATKSSPSNARKS